MAEDVGFEPRFKLPKLACYHYTTSSIYKTYFKLWDLNPLKSYYKNNLSTNIKLLYVSLIINNRTSAKFIIYFILKLYHKFFKKSSCRFPFKRSDKRDSMLC